MNLLNNVEKINRDPQALQVLIYPNPILNIVSNHVTSSIPHDEELQILLKDMEATMKRTDALGLAAIQVGVPLRVLLVRESRLTDKGVKDIFHKIINPVVKSMSEEKSYLVEGCLSTPGVFTKISRPAQVSIQYLNENGEKVETEHDSIIARAILHEMDHLNGVMFFDKMNFVQKASALKKLKKVKKHMI